MKLPEQQPPPRRAGIPKGQFCFGCGGVSTGMHLDRDLLPKPPEPPKETN